MTFRSLALSNVRGNWRSYSAFFLSSVFSVLIFYIYIAFLQHPDVVNGYIASAAKVRPGMKFCLYIIMIFSFLFIMYSNSAFLKTRKQEFGLFSLFGMTRAQLRKLVIYENLVIASAAIAFGIGLGILFSKLFFMALAALLGMEETIAFAVPPQAVWITAGSFFALFFIISIGTVLRMKRTEIIELLGAARKPKGNLVYSPWLVTLSILCLGAGYGMALIMDGNSFIILALPILVVVVTGTYFLFTQASILLLRLVQRNKRLYFNKTNMLIFAQLGYKIRDNARILFTVSILSAVILTAMGTVYIMQIQSKQDLMEMNPFTLAFVEKGLHSHDVIHPDDLKRIVEEDGFSISREARIVAISLDDYEIVFDGENAMRISGIADSEYGALIISSSDYNKILAELDLPLYAAKSGELGLAARNYYNSYGSGTVTGVINGEQAALPLAESTDMAPLNNWIRYNQWTFIMDDLSFIHLLSSIPEAEQRVFYGYELHNWEKAANTVEKLEELVPSDMAPSRDFYRPLRFKEVGETAALTLFVGMFISLLFFIAAGSMIYFKLFTELQEDQAQFKGLSRIGMTGNEVRRIVVTQIAIIFFIPCVVGISHALFAMASLDNMMSSSNWIYSFVVIGIYVGMQTLYFLLASSSYMKSMLRGAAA